ncbi:MAG TPA: hypothetical protein VFJ58_04775 [Armatimonadota bacterium]|nr:hypothetical protein [Armatimonadota bacterium]
MTSGSGVEQERRLTLPGDRSIGSLFTRERSNTSEHGWRRVADARGQIALVGDVEVRLWISREGSLDLSGLKMLAPDALDELILEWGVFQDEDLSFLSHLTGIRRLSVAYTRIGDPGLAYISWLQGLEDLDLRRTRISDTGLSRIRALTSLISLDLSHTRIGDDGIGNLCPFQSLARLELAGTWIGGIGSTALRQLPELRHLDMGATWVDDNALAHIGRLHALRTLDLGGTQIGDRGLARLYGLSNLQLLDLTTDSCFEPFARPNFITQAGLTALKKALPHCEVNVH